jgi:ABC-type nitrate/sulfonate/bicarbonate transport system substrate-binding protein
MLVPPANFYAEKAGFTNIGMIMDYAKDLPMGSTDVSIAWAKAHPDAARHLVAVLDRSIAWFYEDKNRDEAIDILVKVSHANRAEIAESYDFIRRIGMYEKSHGVSRTQLQHLIDAMKSIGDLKDATVTPEQLVIAGLTELTP